MNKVVTGLCLRDRIGLNININYHSNFPILAQKDIPEHVLVLLNDNITIANRPYMYENLVTLCDDSVPVGVLQEIKCYEKMRIRKKIFSKE